MTFGTSHPLDNPIWHALSTSQSKFAETSHLARRFPVEVTALAGFLEPTRENYDSLASLMGMGQSAALFLQSPPAPPAGWTIIEISPLVQMVYDGRGTSASEVEMEELNAANAPEMQELAELTKPGPFGRRTHEMGTYLGIRTGGKLVAMTGERLHMPGFTEVSAVCTHPEHLGHGYARALIGEIVRRICNRNEVPFLHVRRENTRAIELYERLGFETRATFQLAVLSWGHG
jgi:ribosomal protein S18 acetylase RimI-like enzyme